MENSFGQGSMRQLITCTAVLWLDTHNLSAAYRMCRWELQRYGRRHQRAGLRRIQGQMMNVRTKAWWGMERNRSSQGCQDVVSWMEVYRGWQKNSVLPGNGGMMGPHVEVLFGNDTFGRSLGVWLRMNCGVQDEDKPGTSHMEAHWHLVW